MTNNISTDQSCFILKDKACEELDGRRHQEFEEGDDTEEKRLREEAVYEKEMVSLQIEICSNTFLGNSAF
jgi:hypothetical protein